METSQEDIQQLWKAEQDILDVIDALCQKHSLKYSLAYGTLIGAIRHGGFIPWDDDIDIVMPRDDYEKLLSVWSTDAPDGYILQNVRVAPDYTNTFSKIHKDHTTFLQHEGDKAKACHKGIFVDIFPGDRVAPGKLPKLLQYIACAVNLLFTREHTSGSAGVIGTIERVLLRMPKKLHPILRNASEKYIRRWNDNQELMWFFPCTIVCAKRYYSATLFENMSSMVFCQQRYSVVSDPDAFLRVDYGDYMQLPPENERVWAHHPILIDFEHNYEEIECL